MVGPAPGPSGHSGAGATLAPEADGGTGHDDGPTSDARPGATRTRNFRRNAIGPPDAELTILAPLATAPATKGAPLLWRRRSQYRTDGRSSGRARRC